MPDYGPRPRIKRINPMPSLRRVRKLPSREKVESKLMGGVIYEAGRLAGKQAAMLAYNYGLRDPEQLKYIRNFAQDKARRDTLRLLEEMWEDKELGREVNIFAEKPEVASEEMLNMGLRQLMMDNI